MMVEIAPASNAETLEYLHDQLDAHFRALHERRKTLQPPAPVFALEHGVQGEDLRLLQEAVVAAHRGYLLSRASTRWWLPFVVHAAEVGYIYDGVEFWPIYGQATPGWDDTQYERERVRGWFVKFANEFGGAVPNGPWARTFRKIAWPITHAVLPRYLQVQLAKMLSDYRTAWPGLLDDPEALGVRLHSWSRHYSDRLEKFCQNTALVGHVAVALLLSGGDEKSQYIEMATLERLVADLNSERQSRRWLQEARRSAASTIRMHNVKPLLDASGRAIGSRRLPAATDPKLQIMLAGSEWKALAILPDLRPLQHSMPTLYDELRNRRAMVTGSRKVIPTGGLLFATSPVELASWPWPDKAFLQLQGAPGEVNLLIADQCRISNGPWWVFRHAPNEPAAEVKGKFVRPDGRYCIVGSSDQAPPDVPWCKKVEIAVDGVRGYELAVPNALSEDDSRRLVAAGISVVTDVFIRPVGLVASSWDGEGAVEWLAGEPGLIAIRAQHVPAKARLTINGEPYYIEWPLGEVELFLVIDGLGVGTHEISISLGDPDGDGRTNEGTLVATVRDPQVRSEGASAGEGIRLRTVPAQPTLSEIWDGRAVLEVDGPLDTSADLTIALLDGGGTKLGEHRKFINLPITEGSWRKLFSPFRDHPDLAKCYDEADVAEFQISRGGVGFAKLTCERGFRGIRWIISERHRKGGHTARLVDRTDGDPVSVLFYPFETPLIGQPHPSDAQFIGPPRGGLLWATNGEQVAAQIIPPDPNQLLGMGVSQPSLQTGQKTIVEVEKLIERHRQWKDAELPAHPFGMRERQRVLEAITRAIVTLLAPGKWAAFEERITGLAPVDVDLDEPESLVGKLPAHQAAARNIAKNLWKWNSPQALIQGFAEVTTPLTASAGIANNVSAARFLLQLVSSPGELLDWSPKKRQHYLSCVFTDPVLVRAARFAVLGTVDEVAGGLG